MQFNLKAKTNKDLLIHFLIMICVGFIILFGFFYIYLPMTTNHGETITVPNLTGMSVDQIEDFLSARDLEYQINDSTFNPRLAPLTVFQQYPLAGAKVKRNRKIYITLNARNPPMVKMPKLVGRALINAQRELESVGLLLGSIKYIPDVQENTVLKQLANEIEIAEDASIAKGSKIDLIVGDGLGNQEFDVPELTGKPLDEAELALQGSSLQLGTVIYEENAETPEGSVIKQKPLAGSKIRVGDVVDVWISGKEKE